MQTNMLAALPEGVTFAAAAALPTAATTALRALRGLRVVAGRRVLVTGASGGVGRFAVQLGALAGAHVRPLSTSSWARLIVAAVSPSSVVVTRGRSLSAATSAINSVRIVPWPATSPPPVILLETISGWIDTDFRTSGSALKGPARSMADTWPYGLRISPIQPALPAVPAVDSTMSIRSIPASPRCPITSAVWSTTGSAPLSCTMAWIRAATRY